MRESVIQAQIMAYLHERGDCFVWRNNTGAADFGGQTVHFGTKGAADIVGVIWPGRFLAVEVKNARGRVSEAQERWRDDVARAGGLYVLARSVADVRAQLPEPPTERIEFNRSKVYHGAEK